MSQSAAARAVGRRRVATSTGALAIVAVAATATGGAAHADEQYTVRSGDTVSHIAARSGTTVTAIARANALADVSRIRIGQILAIPSTAAPVATPAPAAPSTLGYTVAPGDTVGRIAAKYGTTVAAVIAANGLDARALIRIGQTLQIPGAPAPSAAAPAAPAKASGGYTVKPGDTVSAVATKFGTSVAAIVAANGLDSRALIRIGQTLTIPGAAAPARGRRRQHVRRAHVLRAGRLRGQRQPVHAKSSAVPTKAQMQAKVAATARAMGVDPALAQAIAFQESGFNHAVVSPANAIGTMQVIPSSGAWASDLVGRPAEPRRP